MSTTSGSTRWIVSATLRACWLAGVDRSLTSWPAALRLSEALNVANRTGSFWPWRRSDPAAAVGVGRARVAAVRAAAAADAIRADVRRRTAGLPSGTMESDLLTIGRYPLARHGVSREGRMNPADQLERTPCRSPA